MMEIVLAWAIGYLFGCFIGFFLHRRLNRKTYEEGYVRGYKAAQKIDTEPVIRCSRCAMHEHNGTAGYCNHWHKCTHMDDFCSYGEKEEAWED